MFSQLQNFFSNNNHHHNNNVRNNLDFSQLILNIFPNDDVGYNEDLIQYELSDIIYYDERKNITFNAEDPFMCSFTSLIKPGQYLTKEQLNEELQLFISSGMFEKVNLQYRNNTDLTLSVKISFTENTWQPADSFRCINMGVMQSPMEMQSPRTCLFSPSTHQEVVEMIQVECKDELSARMLYKIKQRVEEWYHDEGYICAKVVRFGDLDTKEVVCEVVEGDITKLVWIEVSKNNTTISISKLPDEMKKLCKNLEVGNVYNIKESKQVVRDLTCLGLFSSIEVNTQPDLMNEGGIIVEIKVCWYNSKTSTNNFIGNWPLNILKSPLSLIYFTS